MEDPEQVVDVGEWHDGDDESEVRLLDPLRVEHDQKSIDSNSLVQHVGLLKAAHGGEQ